MKIARVFPTRTVMSPTDDLAFFDVPGLFPPKDIDEVHISVAFTWDLKRAKELAKEWSDIAPVKIGGPATGMRGENFEPGMYVKSGIIITSRGCRNRQCVNFCKVPEREGNIRELSIRDGYNILDDNLFQCSERHIEAVFEMLSRQKKRPMFTGGVEAKILTKRHIDLLIKSKLKIMYVAYDTPDDYAPLIRFKGLIAGTNIDNRHKIGCYCLIGYKGDTMEKAEKRLRQIMTLNFQPFAMLYRDEENTEQSIEWKRFHREWINPIIVGSKFSKEATDEA